MLRDHLWKTLRHLPEEFSLDNYIGVDGHLKLPVSRGRISFVRKIDSHGRIEINGFPYFIRKKLEGQYVIATIFTHRKKLVVKLDKEIIKVLSFPIKDKIVAPLLSTKSKKFTML